MFLFFCVFFLLGLRKGKEKKVDGLEIFHHKKLKRNKSHLGEDGERVSVGHAPVGGAVPDAVDEALAVPIFC